MLNIKEPNITWTVFNSLCRTVGVQIVGWTGGGGHRWNVYAIVSSKSPIYDNSFDDAPFHGGITMDDRNKSQAFEVKYDFQREKEWRKIGSDYSHFMDEFGNYNPVDGIPVEIQRDAENLIEYIEVLLSGVQ